VTSAADIAQRIRSLLALSVPDLDTSVGSIPGRIADAVSVPVAEAALDQSITRYQYDIDSMTAGTLEGFVRLFGINRKQARYANGTVTFARTAATAALSTATIPVGTRVMSNTNPAIYVQTVAGAVMSINQTTVDVPVQALVPGASGNVAAGTLTLLADDTPGLSTHTTNTLPMTSGLDLEDDETLRNRWKQTVFRNLAGTEQMYRAMALQSEDPVTAVNVIGPKKTWVDRVTVASGTTGAITFGNPEFIYANGVFVAVSLGASNLLSPKTDYAVTINNSVSPATIKIDAVSGGVLVDGDYDISFDYVPTYSRNNPFGTRFNSTQYVNNRVDVWTNGTDPVPVTQACKFSTASSVRFTNSDPTSAMYVNKYQTLDGRNPSNNDVFTPLGFGPILTLPNTLTIGGSTFTEGTHYDIIQRTDAFGLTPTSAAGIVWYASGALPTVGSPFSVAYVYNQVPAVIQRQVESQWRLLGTDVQYHAGIANSYRFHLAVVYLRGFDSTSVNTAINAAISNLVSSLGFDSSLQISDVLQVVHNVAGVDNVRFLNSGDDGTHYAIEQITSNGTSFSPVRLSAISGRAADIYFDDAHYPTFFDTRIVTKTRTNFGAS
jgi:uncharacterized phage protein gp47/JayE